MESTNKRTENTLRKILKSEGFKLTRKRENGETGVDIIASKKDIRYYIEVIGYKKSGPARTKDFYGAFFYAVSRIDENPSKLVMAIPSEFKTGMLARVKNYGSAWKKIGNAFPELEIWFVDNGSKKYERTNWNDWVKTK